MSETKHTPKDWKIERASIIGPSGEVVCLVCSSQANARLIAAAPELLEALKQASRELGGTHTRATDHYDIERGQFIFGGECHVCAAILDAQAAIAKARGEE